MHLDIETVKRFDRETSMWNAPQRFFFSFFFIYRSAVFSLFIVVVVLMDRFRFHLLQLISKTNTNSCRASNFLRILKSNNSNMVECKKKKEKIEDPHTFTQDSSDNCICITFANRQLGQHFNRVHCLHYGFLDNQ